MADWSTVAISLGASGITGGTAIAVAQLNIQSRREEEWRTRQLQAASDFAKQFIGAANAVEYAIRQEGEDPDGRDDAQRLVGEVAPLLGPISLTLGRGSVAAATSRDALRRLERAVAELRRSEWESANTSLRTALERSAAFEEAVVETAGKPSMPWWRAMRPRRRPRVDM